MRRGCTGTLVHYERTVRLQGHRQRQAESLKMGAEGSAAELTKLTAGP